MRPFRPFWLLMWSVIAVTGEQPPSSMAPAILELKSGGLLLIGGSGGSMITSAVASVTGLNSPCFARPVCLHLCLLT